MLPDDPKLRFIRVSIKTHNAISGAASIIRYIPEHVAFSIRLADGLTKRLPFCRLHIWNINEAMEVAGLLPAGAKRDRAIASLVARRLKETAQPATPLLDEINVITNQTVGRGMLDNFFMSSPLLAHLRGKK